MTKSFRPSRPAAFLASFGVVASLGLAACSSDDEGPSASGAEVEEGVAYAQSEIDAATANPDFTFEAPAFDMNGIAGKVIFNIPSTSSVPQNAELDAEMQAVAESYGATWVQYTNQGSPTEWSTGIDQAISQGADLILLPQQIGVELIAPALQRAKDAGIPVVVTHAFQNGEPVPEAVADLITAQVTAPFNEAARLMADWAISETEGAANVLIITTDFSSPSGGMVEAMEEEFATYCPNCTTEVANIPFQEWGTRLASTVQSEIQSNPELNYVLPLYDSMMVHVESGVTAAGATGRVHTASFNGTPEILEALETSDVMTMDISESLPWLAWASMDQVGRVLTGAPTVEDGNEHTPLKVFTKENLDEGVGDAYIEGYEALWGTPA